MKDYHINIFLSEEDGGYIADIPDLAHCAAFWRDTGGGSGRSSQGQVGLDRGHQGGRQARAPAFVSASYLPGTSRPHLTPRYDDGVMLGASLDRIPRALLFGTYGVAEPLDSHD